ncbi:PepSY domain-containing protein [Shewanella canadensis]|uniref:PepSY domain-containing protein n=1 Tax=Shewanella canadensis TaxID=271096 RepID=A0A3S0KWN2_9GAMM|nr:PepSY-associated TM helix domain-containing protein [Shewanella canadensis]RTR40187.1 PepSY domain-containing protein [Shewanella canadensis]
MIHKHHHHRKKSLRTQITKQLRPWHRSLGVISALFILLMALTGMLINHSNHLSIDSAHVEQKWLLDYYGITPPNQINIYQTSPLKLASSDNLIWIDNRLTVEADSSIKGMLSLGRMLIAVDSNNLYLLSKEGELLEKQDAATGLPRGIQAIGYDEQVWLKASDGTYLADDDLIEWEQTQTLAPIAWSKPLVEVSVVNEREMIALQARSSHLTWERVLLDIHSGRFFGSLGPWFMDLVALALIIMSISGIYIWQQQKPKKLRKRK